MGRFDRNNRSGGRDSNRRTEMHSAICDKCGRECKVPFKPSSDKPIYCSDCFEKQGGGRDDRRDDRRDSGRRNFSDSRDRGDRGDREMFSAICDDCGKECKVPFKPSSNKPIYCSACFEKRDNSHDGDSKGKNSFGNNSEQLDLIISKLDQIISALETKKEPVVKKEIKKKVEKKEPVKKEVEKKTKTVKKAKEE